MTEETLGEPKRKMEYNLFDLAKKTFARKIDASYTDGVEHVMLPKALYDELIAAGDEALNWADGNARAFTIETMPSKGLFLAWDVINGDWEFTTAYQVAWDAINGAEDEEGRYTHWTPLPPPPSNPPLPAPLERLGEVLRKVKGTT